MNKQHQTKIFIALLILISTSLGLFAQNAKFEPSDGKALLIIGQDLGAIGKFNAPNNDGYCDFFETIPAGFTSYTSIKNLEGLNTKASYGNGDMHVKAIANNKDFHGTSLAIGLYIVGILDDISRGTYDKNIEYLAQWAIDVNKPIFLRIGYEFNASWANQTPSKYKAAYKHIVDIFRRMNVMNVAYVWQSDGQGSSSHLLQWYPGDDYVDWLAYSHFHNNGNGIIEIARSKDKPVMIAESTPQGYKLPSANGENVWTDWFQPLFDHIAENQNIKALCYINTDWDSKSMWAGQNWGDTRIHKNEVISEKWVEEISNEKWINQDDDVYNAIGFFQTSLNDKYLDLKISLVNNYLTIHDHPNNSYQIELYNLSGQKFFKKKVHTNTKEYINSENIVLALILKDGAVVNISKLKNREK